MQSSERVSDHDFPTSGRAAIVRSRGWSGWLWWGSERSFQYLKPDIRMDRTRCRGAIHSLQLIEPALAQLTLSIAMAAAPLSDARAACFPRVKHTVAPSLCLLGAPGVTGAIFGSLGRAHAENHDTQSHRYGH